MRKLFLATATAVLIGTVLVGCGKTQVKKESNTQATATTIQATESTNTEPEDYVEIPNKEDALGSIDGVSLTEGPKSFADTFGKIGFTLPKKNDAAGIVCDNKKYGDKTILTLTSNGVDHITKEDIEKEGFYGYDIEALDKEKPKMTWGGLTWGATKEDVEKVYGYPTYNYQGSEWTMYEYQFKNYNKLSFYFFKDNGQNKYTGLHKVTYFVSPDVEIPSNENPITPAN